MDDAGRAGPSPATGAPAHLILTVDYELFGNGTGCLRRCVLDPARRLLEVAESHGAPLTLFVEALEFRAMERAGGNAGSGEGAERVRRQIRAAASGGHDVQLHLHPQWLDATPDGSGGWNLPRERWRIGDLPADTVRRAVSEGRRWLEQVVRPARPEFRCRAFRAGAWAIQPAAAVLPALSREGIRIDSSVAPRLFHLARGDWFDYRRAPDALPAWRIDDDVCRPAAGGELLEIPIAVGPASVLGRARREIARGLRGDERRAPACEGSYSGPNGRWQEARGLVSRARCAGRSMLDLCSLEADGLIRVARHWSRERGNGGEPVPVVAIAHTKNFSRAAGRELDRFLARTAGDPAFTFSTYGRWREAARRAERGAATGRDAGDGPAGAEDGAARTGAEGS